MVALRESLPTYTKVVYIAESSLGYHKIGISKHPLRRAEELSVPNILDLHIVHTVPVMFAHKSERTLHAALHEYRISPEWFKLPEDILRTLCECHGEHDMLDFCGVFAG